MASSLFVLKPSSLGDIVHTLPAVAWIKDRRPETSVSWLVNTEWAPLLAGNGTVEKVVRFPRRELRGLRGFVPFLRWARREVEHLRPELALDFQGLLRTALIAKFSGAARIYGLDDAREGAGWFYDCSARTPTGTPHAVERYLALARLALGIDVEATVPAPLCYPLPAGNPPAGAEEFREERYVLLHPYSRGTGKSLTTAQVEELCQRLSPERRVIVVGRSVEGDTLALPAESVNYLNRTNLCELIWLIRHAAFVLSVDSGPMHLAAAFERPLVSIHTWSDPRKVGPYRPDAWVWKGGRIFPFAERHNQEPGFYAQPPPKLAAADLDALAALAIKASTPTARQ